MRERQVGHGDGEEEEKAEEEELDVFVTDVFMGHLKQIEDCRLWHKPGTPIRTLESKPQELPLGSAVSLMGETLSQSLIDVPRIAIERLMKFYEKSEACDGIGGVDFGGAGEDMAAAAEGGGGGEEDDEERDDEEEANADEESAETVEAASSKEADASASDLKAVPVHLFRTLDPVLEADEKAVELFKKKITCTNAKWLARKHRLGKKNARFPSIFQVWDCSSFR